jgi:hypothetical protein
VHHRGIEEDLTNIVGGEAYGEEEAIASGNEVVISGGTVAVSNIAGGFVGKGSTSGVSRNSVIVSGGTVDSTIFGGLNQVGEAVDNTVTLSGSPILKPEKHIRGGRAASGFDAFSGNTLNVWNYSGSSVGSIVNFEYFSFVLPKELKKDGIVLKVNGIVYLNDKTAADSAASRGSQVKEIVIGENINIEVGDKIVLIQADTLDAAGFIQDGETITTSAENGTTAKWSLVVDAQSTPNRLTATLLELSDEKESSGGCEAGPGGFVAGMVILLFTREKLHRLARRR